MLYRLLITAHHPISLSHPPHLPSSSPTPRELHGAPLQPLEFELDDGPAIEALLTSYPDPILVSELPHPSEELEDKIALAQALYREGFLLIHDEASKPEGEEEDDDDDPF